MIPKTEDVRQGTATIYVDAPAGHWSHIFRDALRDFNLLSTVHQPGVTLTTSKRPPEAADGANISVQTADGAISAAYDGVKQSGDFDGKRLHGSTLPFSRQPENVLERARLYLPRQPRLNTPNGLRPAGAEVLKVIAAHGLLHAGGLENPDHSTADLFQDTPRALAGDVARDDKVLIDTGPNAMPPLLLAGATAKNIKSL
jgi:hypothetical protein